MGDTTHKPDYVFPKEGNLGQLPIPHCWVSCPPPTDPQGMKGSVSAPTVGISPKQCIHQNVLGGGS